VIIIDRPPNFNQIQYAFPKAHDHGVMFAYDGNIYNPSGNVIPPALISHEEVHILRQAGVGAQYWWDKYINDSEFRYNEELLAHVAEFKTQRVSNDRNFGARLMMYTALRLVAPLYNYQPPRSLQEAMKDLRREIAK
jgi:tagatose-1,6-bisphosphate aldolase